MTFLSSVTFLFQICLLLILFSVVVMVVVDDDVVLFVIIITFIILQSVLTLTRCYVSESTVLSERLVE